MNINYFHIWILIVDPLFYSSENEWCQKIESRIISRRPQRTEWKGSGLKIEIRIRKAQELPTIAWHKTSYDISRLVTPVLTNLTNRSERDFLLWKVSPSLKWLNNRTLSAELDLSRSTKNQLLHKFGLTIRRYGKEQRVLTLWEQVLISNGESSK